ncbi:MAG: carboxypeptidase-like regulatory domain-containing protein [Bacteroidales bacterium]
MKYFILIVSVFHLMMPVQASENITQTIRGRITDRQTLQPLPGANITIPDSDPFRGTASDKNGYFELRNIPVGRVDVKISFLGYREVYLANINHISARETVLEIQMEEFVIVGNEVVVTAASSKADAINPLASISARGFTVEETERFAGTRNDVSRMASGYAGVSINSDDRNDIVVRGNSPSGLLWRLEGIDIPSPNHWAAFGSTGGPVSMLNNTLLANSDFLSGAFPAEYGNATASVFDLRMRNGNDQTHEHLFQVGFNGFELGAEGPFMKENRGSYLVNFRYSTMEVFEMVGMNFGTTGVPKYHDLSFKLNLPVTRAGSFSLFGLGGRSKIEFLDSNRKGDDLDYYAGEGFDLINSADMGVIGMNHIFTINSNTWLRSTLAVSHRNTRTQMDSLIYPILEPFRIYGNDFRENRFSGALSINSRISNRNSIKTGLNFSMRNLELNDSVYNHDFQQIIDIRNMKGAGWLVQPWFHWQHKLNNDFTLNTGLHYQHYLMNNTRSLEPRLGISYDFLPNQRISLGAGRHSQLLAETVYFSKVFDGNNYHYPNKNAQLMKSDHLVIGYDIKLNTHTRLKLETYYQKLFDVPVNGSVADSYSMLNEGANFGVFSLDTIVSKGIGQNMGVELTVERFFHKGLYYLLTVSVFDSRYRGSDEIWRNTAFNNNYIANFLAGYEFNIGSSSRRQTTMDINIKTTHAGGQRYIPFATVWDDTHQAYDRVWLHDRAFESRYSDYFRTDVSIGFKINTGKVTQEWMIEVTNLFDNQNIHSMDFDKQNGTEKIVPQLGRMIIPQWRIRF